MAEMEAEKKRCLMTGASGYVGGQIRAALLNGGWDVTELSRTASGRPNKIAFRLGDDIDSKLLEGYDALVHCAFDFDQLHWSDTQAINVRGSEKLMRAAVAAGVRNIVFISTMSAFAGCRSRYGRAKLAIEEIAFSLGGWVIRPGLVYGPSPGGMFGSLTHQLQTSSIQPVPDRGRQVLYLIHEDDLAQAVQTCLSKGTPASKAPITVANAQPWELRQILGEIAAGMHRSVHLVPIPWQLLWVPLRILELLGIGGRARSDSLFSLVHQDPAPKFNAAAELGLSCRAFGRGAPGAA
jgi:nucleoside-diphosphate-sugar epimerase